MRWTWIRSIGIIALVAGLWFADYDLWVKPATAAAPVKEDPLLGVTQNWDKVLSAAQRFTVLSAFNNAAVRDNETGLVWEQAPVGGPTTWAIARVVCLSKTSGGRKGWRLPSVHEMASLIDATLPIPTLPTGHPFTINLSSSYWSATLSADNSAAAWHVQFSNGLVSNVDRTNDSFFVWCVRGEMNADAY
jgi:uncharacterized protein DUF1566